ncbi:MAG: hypothetical protein QOF09_4592 [Alphaproteobacteria bacterium]|jgi:tRNA(Ile2) C34 agmatinyltransferase TiaS|nr:hypothetical protein [Alphaproteobacteria bacterium]
MDESDTPPCDRCGTATTFAGRVSLPPHIIYDCKACGKTMWVKLEARPTQQQQQPQADLDESPGGG